MNYLHPLRKPLLEQTSAHWASKFFGDFVSLVIFFAYMQLSKPVVYLVTNGIKTLHSIKTKML